MRNMGGDMMHLSFQKFEVSGQDVDCGCLSEPVGIQCTVCRELFVIPGESPLTELLDWAEQHDCKPVT
jgi:hypothetical protein